MQKDLGEESVAFPSLQAGQTAASQRLAGLPGRQPPVSVLGGK